jgi:hypothetical protein
MKNLRKLVPKEELDALFKEVYQSEYKEEINKEEKKSLDFRFYIFGYKIQKFIKKSFLSVIPIPFKVKDFSVEKYTDSIGKNLISTGYDLEGKFRFFVSIEQKIEDIIKELLEKNGTPFNKTSQEIIEAFLDQLASQILEEINLKKKKLLTSYISFYEDDVISFSFDCSVENKDIKVYVIFEEYLLDFIENSQIIYSPLTTLGKKNLKELKKYIPVRIVFETAPVYIPSFLLKEGEEIAINNLKVRRKKIL